MCVNFVEADSQFGINEMRKFAWRLQRLFDIKKLEEQTKRTELLNITERLAIGRGELLMQKKLLEDIINDLAEEHPKKRLVKQELFLRCSATHNKLIEELKNKISEIEQQQKGKIAEVLEVRRFKEGLGKLRAKAKTQFIKGQEKLEQKETDEMATIGFARKIIQQKRQATHDNFS